MKKLNVVCCLSSVLFLLATGAWAEDAPSVASLDIKPQEHYGRIARKVASMLPTYHVMQQPLGEELSQRAWTNLVTMYDYSRAVFLKSDLDSFEPMRRRIGDALRSEDVSFVYDMHKVFVRRLEECVTYVTNLLETAEFDFSVQEDCQFDRKDAPWPATREERDELWRKRIKNEMLAQILSRELDDEEKSLFLEDLGLTESGLEKLIKASYDLLGLISYLTAGPIESKAWTIKKGTKAPQAAGKIHSDFERGFIRAEVIKYEDFVHYKTEAAVRAAGKMGIEGKDYVVQDGDIMHFLFNV